MWSPRSRVPRADGADRSRSCPAPARITRWTRAPRRPSRIRCHRSSSTSTRAGSTGSEPGSGATAGRARSRRSTRLHTRRCRSDRRLRRSSRSCTPALLHRRRCHSRTSRPCRSTAHRTLAPPGSLRLRRRQADSRRRRRRDTLVRYTRCRPACSCTSCSRPRRETRRRRGTCGRWPRTGLGIRRRPRTRGSRTPAQGAISIAPRVDRSTWRSRATARSTCRTLAPRKRGSTTAGTTTSTDGCERRCPTGTPRRGRSPGAKVAPPQ